MRTPFRAVLSLSVALGLAGVLAPSIASAQGLTPAGTLYRFNLTPPLSGSFGKVTFSAVFSARADRNAGINFAWFSDEADVAANNASVAGFLGFPTGLSAPFTYNNVILGNAANSGGFTDGTFITRLSSPNSGYVVSSVEACGFLVVTDNTPSVCSAPTGTPVPEPASLALISLGIAGIIVRRSARSRSA